MTFIIFRYVYFLLFLYDVNVLGKYFIQYIYFILGACLFNTFRLNIIMILSLYSSLSLLIILLTHSLPSVVAPLFFFTSIIGSCPILFTIISHILAVFVPFIIFSSVFVSLSPSLSLSLSTPLSLCVCVLGQRY